MCRTLLFDIHTSRATRDWGMLFCCGVWLELSVCVCVYLYFIRRYIVEEVAEAQCEDGGSSVL